MGHDQQDGSLGENLTFFSVDHLAIEFGGIRALDDVGFVVKEGTVCSIIGPNGAGKTTLFNVISRLYEASRGRIIFQDQDITRAPPHRIARLGIARTFQNIELFPAATVVQNLLIGRYPRRRSRLLSEMLFLPSVRRMEKTHLEKVDMVLDLLQLQPYRNQWVAHLPYGVRKVVELGRALCAEPKLLLLDEPSSGLNAAETNKMGGWIHQLRETLGVTVLIVEHDMDLVAQVSDRVLALNNGRLLAEGSLAEVWRHPEVTAAYLGRDGWT